MNNDKGAAADCASFAIMVKGYAGGYGTGNNIMVGMTIFSAVPVNRYVCGYCGFTEEWIDREDIERVRNSWRATVEKVGNPYYIEDRQRM